MFAQINQQLQQLQEKVILYRRNEDKIKQLNIEEVELQQKVLKLEKQLIKEQIDVKKLTHGGMIQRFYELIGSYEDKVSKEEREVLEAQLRYDQVKQQLEACQEELSQLNEINQNLRTCEVEYQQMYENKYEMIRNQNSGYADLMINLEKQMMESEVLVKEIEEAIEAGQAVIRSLSNTLSSLDNAKNWGAVDMFGGGFLSDMAKHSNLNQARQQGVKTQRLMSRFNTELADVKLKTQINIEISQLTKFADLFFDGFLVDFLVQSKINKSYDQVLKVKKQVQQVLAQLSNLKRTTEEELTKKRLELESFVHNI